MKKEVGAIVLISYNEKVQVKYSNISLIDSVVALSVAIERLADITHLPKEKVLELVSTGVMKGDKK